MKNLRFLAALALIGVMVMCLPGVAMAAPKTSPPTEGKISADPHKSTVIERNKDLSTKAVNLLASWGTGVSDNMDGTVTIEGFSATYSVVNSLSAKVYLQRWNGSSWVDVTSRTYSASNDLYVDGSSYIAVTGGYYYRTRSVHTATDSSGTDTRSTYSEAIYVD